MFCKAKEGVTEEDYYFAEWSAAEKEAGDHRSVMKFVRPVPKPCALTPLTAVVPLTSGRYHDQPIAPLCYVCLHLLHCLSARLT